MGFMDDLKSNAANVESANHEGLTQSLMSSFQAQGGLSGLVNTFHERGLGGVISSWISTGPNQAISGNQITHALGSDRIAAIASKFGMPASTVTDTLAKVLPGMVDKMTPLGKLPAEKKDAA